MPYIKETQKYELDDEGAIPCTPGELNYVFTKSINDFLDIKGRSYQSFNDAIGALECCKMELYRRLISAYEDQKIEENGDVYA